jgi:hypothetical protein
VSSIHHEVDMLPDGIVISPQEQGSTQIIRVIALFEANDVIVLRVRVRVRVSPRSRISQVLSKISAVEP